MLVIPIIFATNAYGQKGLYLNVGGGYGICIAANSNAASYDRTQIAGLNTNKVSSGSGSFGKGVQFGATVGFMFSENIGAELNVGYLVGTKSTQTLYQDIYMPPTMLSSSYENKMSGNMLRLTPALKFSVGKDKLKPYMRVGLVVGLAGKLKNVVTRNETYSSGASSYLSVEESSYTGGVSLGLSASLGVNYKLSDKLGIFAEIGIISQSWAPNKRLVTLSTVNGVNKLGTMTTNEKETTYLNSYTQVSSSYNPNVPAQALKIAMPFSSVGLNIGVQLSFGKAE